MEVCFANPGTTELPLVAALDSITGVRAILGLFEGVCTGAADGYGRMADRPALTLLHLGPGFANGIANLHNARRAHTPLVNIIGDHATWHRPVDAPLTSDIASLAHPVSGWVRESRSARELPDDFAEAIRASLSPPGRVATLIVPADCQWEESEPPRGSAIPAADPRRVAADRVEATAVALRDSRRPALLLGGHALRDRGLAAANRIAAATDALVLCPTFPARVERGAGRAGVERLPYFPDLAIEALAGVDALVLAGTPEPVAFFGHPSTPSQLAPSDTARILLSNVEEDSTQALEDLAATLDTPPATLIDAVRPDPPTGELTPATLGAALAALQPENAIVVDEGATSGMPYYAAAAGAPPHSYLALTGGAIGQGLPCATGAAIACPDRKVIALQADGSGLYTLQALWTQAREGLDVVTLICANRSYRILQIEMARAGIAEPGPQARSLTDLDRPTIDWVSLAQGFGVPGTRVETSEQLVDALERALTASGPRLIEVILR